MTSLPTAMATDAEHERELIERHGIAVIRAEQFCVDGYRYTNLVDALAQARRSSAGGR